jgi:nucleoside-diphosphate-sugar epimerase
MRDSGILAAIRRFALIGKAAFSARYRLHSPQGVLVLLAAIFDPYIYALTVYFVLTTVFQMSGAERFHILLIGFISFRWGISSLVASANLPGVMARMREHSSTPLCAAVIAVVTPPACVFVLSLASAYVFSAMLGSPLQSFAAIAWLPFVVAIQGVWTVALILALAYIRGRQMLTGDGPVVAAASLMWILSPVMYTFRDIPEGASKLLTSYNPVSHLLAAYQNTYWYGQAISLEVLPWVTVLGLGLIGLLGRYVFGGPRRNLADASRHRAGVRLVYLRAGAAEPDAAAVRLTPWRARFRDLRGRDLVRMIVANWGLSRLERDRRIEEIARDSTVERLFDDYLAIYPDQALDQLAFAVAMRSPAPAITLDGILDTLAPGFRVAAWEAMVRAAEQGRSIDIVCRQPVPPPDLAAGVFEIIGPGGVVARGKIGPELALAYDRPVVLVADEIPVSAAGAQEISAFPAILVTGASSQIGQCVVHRLCQARRPVVALGRGRPRYSMNAHLRFIEGDLEKTGIAFPESLSSVVHIAGIWLLPNHLDALHARGVRRIVCFSSTSIFVKQGSSNIGERDLVARMKAAEAEVAARCKVLGIVWTVLRPTLVYGLGIDRNVSRAARFIRRFGVYPLASAATGMRQPVHADDLAAAALAALAAPAAAGRSYELGGGEVLNYREMIGRIFDALERRRRFLAIPGLEILAAVVGIVLRRPEVTGEMVRRMRQDLVCDNGPAARDLSYRPRNFLAGGGADLGLDGIDSRTPR